MGCDGWLRRHRLLRAEGGICGFPQHQPFLGEQNQLLVPKPVTHPWLYPLASRPACHRAAFPAACQSSYPKFTPLSAGLKAIGMILSPQGS